MIILSSFAFGIKTEYLLLSHGNLSPMSCVLVVACPMLGCLAHAVLVLEMPIHFHMLVNVAHDAPEREHGSFVPQRHFMYHGKMIS